MAISSPEMMLVPVAGQLGVGSQTRCEIHTQVDVTETTATDLAADSVLVADTEILHACQLQPCRCRGRTRAGSLVPLSSCLQGVNLEEAGLRTGWVVMEGCVEVQSSRDGEVGEVQPARVYRSVKEALPTRR